MEGWREEGEREGEEWTDGWMYGRMGRSAGAPGTGRLCCCQCPWGHEGIKALHINTIMKEKKKKVKQCDEEMENGMWPFYFFFSLFSESHATTSYIPPFWMQLVIVSLSRSLFPSSPPSPTPSKSARSRSSALRAPSPQLWLGLAGG